ncbi:hypothetical protein Lser_V15G04919 [Lactuca serriola]
MYLATAYDKASEIWTTLSPTISEVKRSGVYARSSSNLLTKLILQDQVDSYGWQWKLVAQGKTSKAFQPLLLTNKSAFPDKFKLWYDSLGGDAIGLTWEKENSKRRREDDGDVKKSVRDTLKDVGEVGKGFVKSVYLLKEPTR